MPLRALIVDDDVNFAKVVEMRLKGWRADIDLTIVYNLTEARKTLDSIETPFDLVVLDQHLPDGIGFELIEHTALAPSTVLAVSSDDDPDLPADTVRAGAQHFLGKRQVTQPLFIPLVEALLDRKQLEKKLREAEVQEAKIGSIKTLLATLKHEINNPLGAVLGAAYLIKQEGQLEENQADAVKLIEESGKRINHVLQQLCDAAELERITKAQEEVFHVPGDEPWTVKDKDK